MTVYAPASVGNIGPGFDTLGMAVTEMGDTLTGFLERRNGTDRIESISGAWTELPMDPSQNTATIAARWLLDKAGHSDLRLTVSIRKGVPGSGLGSSAASAVGGAMLAQVLCGSPFSGNELLEAAALSESSVSGGYFLDNVSASLFGGVSVSNSRLGQSFRFGSLSGLYLVFLIPRTLLKTSESRKVLPQEVPLEKAVGALSNTAGLLTAIHLGNPDLFCRMLQDPLIQPYRQKLIPSFGDLEKVSVDAGARSFIISGAGSTMLALTDSPQGARTLQSALEKYIQENKLPILVRSSTIDSEGARHVASTDL
ncbi:MAG: homoserine kinase [Nitrospirae bacterium]|jgi:homoserine kinase|nr:homoserine kinase [Nitrospirota bacterium]